MSNYLKIAHLLKKNVEIRSVELEIQGGDTQTNGQLWRNGSPLEKQTRSPRSARYTSDNHAESYNYRPREITAELFMCHCLPSFAIPGSGLA